MKSSELRYAPAKDVPFILDLKMQAARYFEASGAHRWGDAAAIFKGLFLFAFAIGAYWGALQSRTFGIFAAAYVVFMFASMLLAMNVLHDAAHLAVFQTKWLNRWVNRLIALPLGIDPDYWTVRHVRYHHVHPNVDGLDLDIEANAFLRQTPFQPYMKHFRFQHMYWPLVAALSLPYINWVFDWSDRLGKTVIAQEKVLNGAQGWLIFVAAKILHIGMTLGAPILLLPHLSVWQIIAVYVCAQLVASFFVVAMILGTHWADVEFFVAPENQQMPHTWVEHSFRTAVDWQPKPRWLTYWMGGLNLHLTHHVFPTRHHRHYPALAQIVKQTAAAHGWAYREIDYQTLVRLQQQFLKRMGRSPL
jgi:linoleoyl-CoA desaturase